MNKIKQQRDHFENISEKYYVSRRAESHLLLKDLMWGLFFSDKEYLKRKNITVLEPMCGYGEGREILEKHLGIKVKYSGFDYSKSLIAKIKDKNPAADVVVQDITRFIPSKKYDLIIIVGGLHHVPDYTSDILKKLHASLDKNGYFIYLEPTHNNFLFKKIRERIYKKNEFFDNETERAFELKTINKLFDQQGFSLVDQIYPGLLSYTLFYNPDAFPFLNKGGSWLVRALFSLDKLFIKNIVGRKFSFATLSLYQKK